MPHEGRKQEFMLFFFCRGFEGGAVVEFHRPSRAFQCLSSVQFSHSVVSDSL